MNLFNTLDRLVRFYHNASFWICSFSGALSLIFFHVVNFTDQDWVLIAFEIAKLFQNRWISESVDLCWNDVICCMIRTFLVHHVALWMAFFACFSARHLSWCQRGRLDVLWLTWHWRQRQRSFTFFVVYQLSQNVFEVPFDPATFGLCFLLLPKECSNGNCGSLLEVIINFDGLLFGFGTGCGFFDDGCCEPPLVAGERFVKFNRIKWEMTGFIGSIITRASFSFFFPFEFFSGTCKLQILAVNIAIGVYKLRRFHRTWSWIFWFGISQGIIEEWIVKIVGLVGIKWVDILHDLLTTDVERDVDIDGLAIWVLLNGRIVVH